MHTHTYIYVPTNVCIEGEHTYTLTPYILHTHTSGTRAVRFLSGLLGGVGLGGWEGKGEGVQWVVLQRFGRGSASEIVDGVASLLFLSRYTHSCRRSCRCSCKLQRFWRGSASEVVDVGTHSYTHIHTDRCVQCTHTHTYAHTHTHRRRPPYGCRCCRIYIFTKGSEKNIHTTET